MAAEKENNIVFKQVSLTILFVIVFMLLHIKVQAGNNLSTASAFSIGNTLNGNLGDKRVYYRFALDSNACVRFSAKTEEHDQHVAVYLHDSEGEQMSAFSTNDENNWGYQTGSLNYALSAGTYYLELWGSGAYYTLETSFLAATSDSVKIGGQANCYLNTAVPFEVGDQLTSISERKAYMWNSEVCHYYRFYISAPITVKFEISGAFGDRLDHNFFNLYDSQGEVIRNLKISLGSELNQYSTSVALTTGTYYVGITAISRAEGYSIRTSSSVAVAKVAGVKVSSPSKGKVKVRWRKVKNASYEVRICRKKNFKGSKVYKKDISNSSSNSYTRRGLKKGKIFYVQVRAYKIINGNKFYGSWSAKKRVRIRR